VCSRRNHSMETVSRAKAVLKASVGLTDDEVRRLRWRVVGELRRELHRLESYHRDLGLLQTRITNLRRFLKGKVEL
jgi:hypothetical protein